MSEHALEVPAIFRARAEDAEARLALLHDQLRVAELVGDGDREVDGHPRLALFATGSLARAEAGTRSDLDVFLVDTAEGTEPRLTNLETIVVLARLIQAAELAEFPAFSGDGRFLVVHPIDELFERLGTSEDDSTNVYTARMLLLLESRPLLGAAAYERLVERTIATYARDASDSDPFLPTFLINDVVRYWKTLCLSYEAKRHTLHAARKKAEAGPSDTAELRRIRALTVEHRLDLLKLRFNRLWICFNGLAFLLAGANEGKVERDHVRQLVQLTPIERAEQLAHELPACVPALETALEAYGEFLTFTDQDKDAVMLKLHDDELHDDLRALSRNFGDRMDEVVALHAERAGLARFLLL